MALSGAISVEVVQRADAAGGPIYWANRWEVGSSFGGAGLDPTLVAQAFANFHLGLLMPNFFVDYVRLSTYAPDSEPYNPDSLFVLPISERGSYSAGINREQVLPLNNVLHLRKLVGSGRLGHTFLRGFLVEGEIQSDPNSGAVSLIDTAAVQGTVNAAFSALQAALGGAASVSLISGSGLVLQERNVTGLNVKGITTRNLRTKRKSRLVQNAGLRIASTLAGGVTLDEIPELIDDVRRIAGAVGISIPQLPG